MDLIQIYKNKLSLPAARFTSIDHEDAMVAAVFKIEQNHCADLILKVCTRTSDALREAYFLNRFAGKLPVPRLCQLIEPEEGSPAAVLMEYVPGTLLKKDFVTDVLAYKIGELLACIHLERTESYGDLIEPATLNQDARLGFTQKFQEGLQECEGHLPKVLLASCQRHFDRYIDLALSSDGPCIIHRDFRPGNIIVKGEKVSGIIDWSSGRSGFAEEDFCPLESGEWLAKYKTAFLKGYANKRKVPDYQAIMPLLSLSRAIGVVGFTIKRGLWNTTQKSLYQSHLSYLQSLQNA